MPGAAFETSISKPCHQALQRNIINELRKVKADICLEEFHHVGKNDTDT